MNAAQQLILENIAEEAAELIQAKSKIMRFGLEDAHPKHPDKTNEQLFYEEFADLLVAFEAWEIDHYVWEHHLNEHMNRKRQKLVNRHPLVYGPIFGLDPEPNYDKPLEPADEQSQIPVPENKLPADLRLPRYKPVVPGDISYGGVTNKKYVAVKYRHHIVWELAKDGQDP